MISRVADHCFWFGRYVERAESTARMLAASVHLALDGDLPPAHVWRPVLVVAGVEDEFRRRITGGLESSGSAGPRSDAEGHRGGWIDDHPAWGDGEVVQRFMAWDEDNGVSLARSVIGARWNARSIREVLSLEAWETVNELHLWWRSDGARAGYTQHREAFYQHVRRSTQLTLGLLRSTMLHDEPLDFVWLGVLLERVSQTARMLDVHHHAFTNLAPRTGDTVVETALWLSLLRALSGGEAYMKRAAGRVDPEGVGRFLVSEPAFPRSIAYCVHSAYERLCDIRPPEHAQLPGGVSLERLRVLDERVAAHRDRPLGSAEVHGLLTHVVDEVHEICTTLGRELFGVP